MSRQTKTKNEEDENEEDDDEEYDDDDQEEPRVKDEKLDCSFSILSARACVLGIFPSGGKVSHVSLKK
jgi:hypothetical protein